MKTLPIQPDSADLARRSVALAMLSAGALAAAGCSPRTQVPVVGYTLLDGSNGLTLDLSGRVTDRFLGEADIDCLGQRIERLLDEA